MVYAVWATYVIQDSPCKWMFLWVCANTKHLQEKGHKIWIEHLPCDSTWHILFRVIHTVPYEAVSRLRDGLPSIPKSSCRSTARRLLPPRSPYFGWQDSREAGLLPWVLWAGWSSLQDSPRGRWVAVTGSPTQPAFPGTGHGEGHSMAMASEGK